MAGESPRGICHLSFVDSGDLDQAVAVLKNDWPAAHLHRDDSIAQRLSTRIFERDGKTRSRPPLQALVRGSAFQVRVWRALLGIPHGTLVSYSHLATILNQPSAARAVGSAVGQNALAYLIPCHRVIRETGVIGHYRWGPVRKRALIAWECTARAPGEERNARNIEPLSANKELPEPNSSRTGTHVHNSRPSAVNDGP
jgi:AraC family transcriptional regulator of adaptative response/methylated-DNA-[protein]-cysteine methyltransferase